MWVREALRCIFTQDTFAALHSVDDFLKSASIRMTACIGSFIKIKFIGISEFAQI